MVATVMTLIVSAARAEVYLDFIDRGTPRTDTQTMHGFYAFVVRVWTPRGNILAVDFATPFPMYPRPGFYGGMAQRWTSPSGDGNYTLSSPGFHTESNLTSSPLNFDTHFLGTPSDFVIDSPLEEGNVIFPYGNPIPSDEYTGYGVGIDQGDLGYLRGAYRVVESARSPVLDIMYLVGRSDVAITGRVTTEEGIFIVGAVLPPIPEPSASLTALGAAVVGLRRRARPR
jgi:hypothetical protein